MNASIAKLEQQKPAGSVILPRSWTPLSAGANFTPAFSLFLAEKKASGRQHAGLLRLSERARRTIAELKQTREQVATQKAERKRSKANNKRCCMSSAPAGEAGAGVMNVKRLPD